MRVTLENQTGKTHGRLVLSTGQFMRIGSRAAELTGGEDRFMSSLHFLIECKADRCRIADMGSKNGTFVNGSRITDAVLSDGDLILAGQTFFRVHIDSEDGAQRPAGGPIQHFTSAFGDETMVLRQEAKDLRDVLYAYPGERLYAVLDPTQDDCMVELLRESKEQYQSLCLGPQTGTLDTAAPCLVEIPKGSPLLTILIKGGWERNWGIYLTSTEFFQQVHGHLCRFLAIQTEKGGERCLRFYDPRVLRPFLAACSEEDRKSFFGPIQHILVEDEDASVALRFSVSGGIPEEIKVRTELKDKRRRVTDLFLRK